MAAHSYRYKRTGPADVGRLQKLVGGAALSLGSASSVYLTIGADSTQKSDLDDAMAAMGYAFDSTDPGTTADAQSGTAMGTIFDPRRLVWFDPFVLGSATAGQLGMMGWNVETVGTGPNVLLIAGETGRPGLVRLEGGTSAAARSAIHLGDSVVGNSIKLAGSQNTMFAGFRIRPHNTIAATDLESLIFGFGAEFTLDQEPSNGVYVRYAPATDLIGGYTLVNANGGTRTTATSGVLPVVDTWKDFEIQITYPGGVPTATLYIGGVSVAGPITANFPANAVSPGIMIRSIGSVVLEPMVDCDLTYGYQDYAAS